MVFGERERGRKMRKQNVFSTNIIWGGASRKSFQRKHSEKCQSYTKFKFLRETETIISYYYLYKLWLFVVTFFSSYYVF